MLHRLCRTQFEWWPYIVLSAWCTVYRTFYTLVRRRGKVEPRDRVCPHGDMNHVRESINLPSSGLMVLLTPLDCFGRQSLHRWWEAHPHIRLTHSAAGVLCLPILPKACFASKNIDVRSHQCAQQ